MSGKLDRMLDEIDQLEQEARSLETPDARLIVPVIGVLRELMVRWETDARLDALARIEQTVRRIDTDGTSLVDVHASMKISSQRLEQASTSLTDLHDVHRVLMSLNEAVQATKKQIDADRRSYRHSMKDTVKMAESARAHFRHISLTVWGVAVVVWVLSWVGAMWSLRAWTPDWFLTEEQQAKMMTEEDQGMIEHGKRFGAVWWTLTPEQREALNETEGWTYRTQQETEAE